MKQYNIYAGLGGGFGGARYKYTGLYVTSEEAEEDAFQSACEEFESYGTLHGLPSWEEATEEYCADYGLEENSLTDKDLQNIEEYYNEYKEDWLEYYALPTDEDNIDEEDLILDYVITDDSFSQTNSK